MRKKEKPRKLLKTPGRDTYIRLIILIALLKGEMVLSAVSGVWNGCNTWLNYIHW